MYGVLSVTAPIYLLVATGFLCTRLGLFQRAELRVFGKYVINVALPALLFNALSQRNLSEVLHADFLAAYGLGSLAMIGLGLLWTLRVQRQPLSKAAVMTMGMSCCNSGFVGFPLVTQLVGGATAAVCLALAMVVENLLLLPLVMALADSDVGEAATTSRGERWRLALSQSMKGLARNPMIYGLILGFLFAGLGWRLPDPAARAVGLVAASSSAISLFVIGGSLVGVSARGLLRDAGTIAAGKLLLHPLLVLAVVMLMPPMARELQLAVIVMAAVPMLGIYPILAQKHGHDAMAAGAQLGTTVASFFTLTALLWVLKPAV